MARNGKTTALIDGILKFIMAGGVITLAAMAPNMLQVLDKPLTKYLNKLDERSQEREVKRVVNYMRRAGLINYDSKNYQHGIKLTERGKQRALTINLDELKIKPPVFWDKKWRLILFDIPEQYKANRNAFVTFLRGLGLYRLQKSVWLHPFPCKREISVASSQYDVNRFVTYIETAHIDREYILVERFFKPKKVI